MDKQDEIKLSNKLQSALNLANEIIEEYDSHNPDFYMLADLGKDLADCIVELSENEGQNLNCPMVP